MALKQYRNTGFLLLFLFFSRMVPGQIQVELTTDTSNIRLGEQIHLDLKVKTPLNDSIQISWPIVSDTLSEHIDVVDILPVDTVKTAGRAIFTQKWVLTSFDSGYHEIPPFNLTVNGQEIETDPLMIHVETVKVDTTKAFKDIKGVQTVPITMLDWIKYHWKWFAGLGMLAILILGIYFILRNQKKEKVFVLKKPKPQIPPYEHALKRLDELREKKLWKTGEVKEPCADFRNIT